MKRFSVILLSVFVGGCASLPSTQPPATPHQTISSNDRQAQLEQIKSWTASGALSITQASRQPTIMHYQWKQQGPVNYRVDLAASLNLGQVSIISSGGRVALLRGNEPPKTASTPEDLMRETLGWTLPIPDLWFWARGLPGPGNTQNVQYDKFGHLVALQQGGWQLRLADYRSVQGVDLPQIIQLQRAALAAKIVITQWQVGLPRQSKSLVTSSIELLPGWIPNLDLV